jgi:hypothetical protein
MVLACALLPSAIPRNTKKVETESKIRDTRPDEFTQHSREVGISFGGGWGTDYGKATSANGSCQQSKHITWPEGPSVSPDSRGIWRDAPADGKNGMGFERQSGVVSRLFHPGLERRPARGVNRRGCRGSTNCWPVAPTEKKKKKVQPPPPSIFAMEGP